MGRIFETRKHTMFARWNKMAKLFTRLAKEIAIAVKAGGPSADSNPALRRVLQNARAANMPKDKIENAIKKASGQGAESYDIVMYEGYAPHGVAVMVETATNNVVLVSGLPAGPMREYLLYLPLYNGVSSVEVGVPKGTKLSRAAQRPPEGPWPRA